jgi:hypothetical protein
MPLPDALTAIRNRITTAYPAMPIRWPGKRFQVPKPPTMFFVFDFLGSSPVTAGIAATGSHLHREFASFAVHVLVPDGDGDAALNATCQQLADLFRVTSFAAAVGQVNCDGEPRIDPLPSDAMEGAWFGRSVVVDFRHDFVG